MSASERIAAGLAALVLSAAALAQSVPQASASAPMHHHGHGHAAAACSGSGLACAKSATAVFDSVGALWVAWAAAGSVSVARSTDAGATFGPASVVGSPGASLDGGTDARPQIVVDGRGRIVVAYSVFKDKAWNAQVMVATSTDGGASFSAPRSLSADPASQRFPALALRSDGRLLAVWLDKRTAAAARSRGVPHAGAALAPLCRRWGESQILQLAPHLVVGGQGVEICRQAQHRQYAQVSAQGGARIAGFDLVNRSARHASPLRHHGRAQVAAQPGQPQAFAQGGEPRLLLEKNDGWLARHFAIIDNKFFICLF